MLFGCIEVSLRIFFDRVGLLNHGLGNSSMLEQITRTRISLVGELFIIDRLKKRIEGGADFRALHLEEQLSFFYLVVKASLDVDHPAVGKGNDGEFARDIGRYASS